MLHLQSQRKPRSGLADASPHLLTDYRGGRRDSDNRAQHARTANRLRGATDEHLTHATFAHRPRLQRLRKTLFRSAVVPPSADASIAVERRTDDEDKTGPLTVVWSAH
jgi:hypothetical protein